MPSNTQKRKNSSNPHKEMRGKVLAWYDQNARDLPWRYHKGEEPDPYQVWLSEVMLQQTTVPAVKTYFKKFIQTWPNIHALASAEREEVMAAWAGLGYYSRARNLHKCAQIISSEMNGIFPSDLKALKALPGIGDYTAAAIRAIAFNLPAVVVDGNIERITARVFKIEEALPKAKTILREKAGVLFEGEIKRVGDFAQALMDIGSDICMPRNPSCHECPLNKECLGQEIAETLPRRETKKEQPLRTGKVYWIENENKEVLMHKRPDTMMLGGMLGLPTTQWDNRNSQYRNLMDLIVLDEQFLDIKAYHTFTHFNLELELIQASFNEAIPEEYVWIKYTDLDISTLPTVFKKAFKLFLSSERS